MTLDFRDVFYVAPAIVLTAWGLLVLLVDVFLARRLSLSARRQSVGVLSLIGVGVALISRDCRLLGASVASSRSARLGIIV